ncbi:hypothetical protein F5148DRAFT_1147413 [Russula earlei]|uniref:Uncharacterized protein n=1 Tax=Russula earlei TaxID=71964 RepID=A0ACC0UGA9_9AGAM|nr:hypothetical protein F5148DRAFT_1147413 [Russula earlei]
MAVLVPQDWHPPKDHAMESPASNSSNPSVPRQRVSPPHDPSSASSRVSSPQNHHYPYPVQQQQAGWNTHGQPFYAAAFYQNPHQQPYSMHPSQQGQVPPHGPFFDPNAQFAQWAYQQMIRHTNFLHMGRPRLLNAGAPPSTSTPADYFAQSQLHNFNPFPSGTPPPHPSQLPNGYRSGTTSNGSTSGGGSAQYDGFHPYRRPNHRQATQQSSEQPATGDWRQQAIQPPYARADAAGSTTSVNSVGSGPRQRTSSLQGSSNGASASSHLHTGNNSAAGSIRSRSGSSPQQQAHPSTGSTGRNSGNVATTSTSSSTQTSSRPHHRNPSSSSSSTSSVTRTPSSPSVLHAPTPRPARPSPLSQGMSTAEKRMSRDDSELLEPLPNAAAIRSGGLKGRLRRALSLSATTAISEEESSSALPPSASSLTSPASGLQSNAADAGDTGSTATKQAKKKRTALFNSRLNASTDNISLSSTMSSASVVIRKLGSIGKLARRNSLAGITSLFKDKKDRDESGENGGKKSKKKKGEKGEAAEASVSHVTAELDRTSSEWSAELNGLSPAAKLARQHTLKSNAEAAAKAKAQEEAGATAAADAATAAAASASSANQVTEPVPATWEKNTTTNRGSLDAVRVNEDGMHVLIEDDDSGSDGESEHPHDYSAHVEGWEDEDWSHIEDDEDLTIRQGLERTSLGDDEYDHEPWAMGIRRSVEHADDYDQHNFMDTPANYSRHRSNSYNSHPSKAHELGPLARIPSPNPDHIDGLRHPSVSSGPSIFLPALSFEDDEAIRPSSERTLFNHPNLNSSAPVLSTMLSSPPTLAHRSATTPVKRLAFASNLSVYDTFPSSVYDRRSEPATWSRLTPALAQRIKEELNSFKMEEMEVHAASRIHTQFFV